MSDTTASEMREVFNSFDANGDGTIDAAELANILRSLGYNPSQDQAEEMVRQADGDGDGQLSFEEFMAVAGQGNVKTNVEMEVEEINIAFERMDKEGKGAVDGRQLAQIMQAFGRDVSNEQVEMMLQHGGKNGERISCDDFVKYIYGDAAEDSEDD